MAEATGYSCPQCRATLKLDPASGKLTCEFCGGSYDVDQIETLVDKESSARKEVERHGRKWQLEQKKKGQEGSGFSYVAPEGITTRTIDEWEQVLAEGDQEQFDEVVGYTCSNCAAQVVTDKLTVATSCQYCGGSVVVDQRLSGGLKPGFVIPFKVSAKDLPKKLTEFYNDRPLLPKNFFYENQIGEVQGLYVPFWLYDGTVDGEASYESTESSHYRSGDYDVSEYWYYSHERKGTVEFNDVPVDASERIDDDLMDSLEPFGYKDMVPFKPGYLTGFVAERFDQSPRQVFDRAGNRMKMTSKDLFFASVPHGRIKTKGASFEFSSAAASYVLLPVYLFNCKYMGKMYRYAVNGQTGKIVGEVPTGKRESLMAFLKSFIKWFGIGLIGIAVIAVLIWVFG